MYKSIEEKREAREGLELFLSAYYDTNIFFFPKHN